MLRYSGSSTQVFFLHILANYVLYLLAFLIHFARLIKQLVPLQPTENFPKVLQCFDGFQEQVDAIHQDLKQFNTQFRELQRQTNEVLEQKVSVRVFNDFPSTALQLL